MKLILITYLLAHCLVFFNAKVRRLFEVKKEKGKKLAGFYKIPLLQSGGLQPLGIPNDDAQPFKKSRFVLYNAF